MKYLQDHLQESPNSQISYEMLDKVIGKLKKGSLLKCRNTLELMFPQKKEEINQIFSRKKRFFRRVGGIFNRAPSKPSKKS